MWSSAMSWLRVTCCRRAWMIGAKSGGCWWGRGGGARDWGVWVATIARLRVTCCRRACMIGANSGGCWLGQRMVHVDWGCLGVDPVAVSQHAKVMKTVREKSKLFSESQRIQYTIQTRTQDIPYARTYLLTLKDIRIKRGLTDDLGAEAMMDALDKIEKEIKKPLMRNEKKSMALLTAEFDKTNKQLGIRKEDLPKYEEQLELKIAKAQLEELKKDALEAMETQTKREEFKDETLPDIKSLDIRNFI
ncbi:probable ATP synthase 24 kDa subunit, mitochondrial [Hibiscus syriacus]|uniref:probable ATP synthase 24 kDa subunit, mitochondrial n=1 Tax=Hibiscus syriacus TaxID=106335 RepID=UPI0019206B14|nr:probable ATP synthase 24 kDa subunit, mitochondrial [Hibiscus syriacus]